MPDHLPSQQTSPLPPTSEGEADLAEVVTLPLVTLPLVTLPVVVPAQRGSDAGARALPVVHASEEGEATELTAALRQRLGQPLIVHRGRWSLPTYLVVLSLGRHDARGVRAHDGVLPTLARALAEEVHEGLGELEDAWVDVERGRVVAVLTSDRPTTLVQRLDALSSHTSRTPLRLPDGSQRHVEVGIGWTRLPRRIEPSELDDRLRQTGAAANRALRNRDHVAVEVGGERRVRRFVPPGLRLAVQVLATVAGSILLPFGAMVLAYENGHDLATAAYLVVVAALGITATLIWVESLHALDPPRLPGEPATPAPPATAVVAAYLPNEADTIIETLQHFLRQDYPGDLQVILAYNTPEPCPSRRSSPRSRGSTRAWSCCTSPDSTSKAQNVNAALAWSRGEFVGIFDADHHPMAGRLQPRLALDRRRRRRRPGPLRGPQRRRVAGRAHWSPWSSSRSTPSATPAAPAARLRRLRRLQRVLAHRGAAADPDARRPAHRGHRLLDPVGDGRSHDRQRPRPGQPRAGPGSCAAALAPADALGAGLVPGVAAPPRARPAQSPPLAAPAARHAVLLGWREVYPWISSMLVAAAGVLRLARRRTVAGHRRCSC